MVSEAVIIDAVRTPMGRSKGGCFVIKEQRI